MRKLIIPSILAVTVLIAGIFAFMPIEKVSTVHGSIQANTARVSEDLIAVTVADTDLVIECPAASSGCHILEVYVEENDGTAGAGADIDLGAVTGTIDGDPVTIVTNLATTVSEARVVLSGISGVAIGSGDILTIDVVAGTSESAIYNMRVVALVQGGTSIDART